MRPHVLLLLLCCWAAAVAGALNGSKRGDHTSVVVMDYTTWNISGAGAGADRGGGSCGRPDRGCPMDADCREARLAQHLQAALPPFVVSSPQVTNQRCLHDSQVFRRELNRLSTWALKMHDASAKLPSGILSGNVNQYGDFDECLAVNSAPQTPEISGKYCLTYIDIQVAEDSSHLQDLHRLVQSHGAFRSSLEDPGHRIPRYSSINWGLCVPHSCQASDVQTELDRVLQSQLAPAGLRVRVKVDADMCVRKTGWTPLPISTLLVGFLFLCVLGLAVTATLCDHVLSESRGTASQLLRAFSLRGNTAVLMRTAPSGDDLDSVHGIRLLNAYMLLTCHKSMALFFNPYINRTQMTEIMGMPWAVIGRAASLYTDPFLMLSGLLTSYSYLKQLEGGRGIQARREVASRLFRLVPNLAAIILFCTFLLPMLGSGPQWSLVVDHHATICKEHWWKNLLFIHNYFGFENMCLTHTHHLGIDTQLFLLAPALVYALWRWPRGGAAGLAAVAAASTYLRYHVTYTKQLSLFVYFGASVSQLFRTADLSYILPSHRLTVYIMGIFLGYILRHCGREFPLKKLHLATGWTVTAVLVYLALLEPSRMGRLTYVYDPTDAATYAAFAPILWCLVFAWVIFTSHTGNGGVIGRAMSWPGFKVTTRLSYAFYLTQFPIFFYNVGRTRSSEYYVTTMLVNIPETMFIVAASAILYLLFELPFQNIRNILLKKRKAA